MSKRQHDKYGSGEKSLKRQPSGALDGVPGEPGDQQNLTFPSEAPASPPILHSVSSNGPAITGDQLLYLAVAGIGLLVFLVFIGCSVHFIKKCCSQKEKKHYSSDNRKKRHSGPQTPDADADSLYSPYSRTPSIWSSRMKGVKSATSSGQFDEEERGSLDQSEVPEKGGDITSMSKSISSNSSSNSNSGSPGSKGKSPAPTPPPSLPQSIAVNRDESQEVRKIKSTASHMSTGSTMSSGTPRSLIGSTHKRSVKAKGPAQGLSVTTVSTVTPSAYGGSTSSLLSGTGNTFNPNKGFRPLFTPKTLSEAEKPKEKTLPSSSISSSANANIKQLAKSNLPMSSACGGVKEAKTDSVSKAAAEKGSVLGTAKETPKT